MQPSSLVRAVSENTGFRRIGRRTLPAAGPNWDIASQAAGLWRQLGGNSAEGRKALEKTGQIDARMRKL